MAPGAVCRGPTLEPPVAAAVCMAAKAASCKSLKGARMGAHAPRLTPASVGAGSVGAGSLHTAAAADPVLRLRQLLLDGAPCPPAGAVVRVGATG